jgi:hypothetical protein
MPLPSSGNITMSTYSTSLYSTNLEWVRWRVLFALSNIRYRAILKKYKAQLQVGSLEDKASSAPAPAPAPAPTKSEPVQVEPAKSVVEKSAAALTAPAVSELKESLEPIGDLIPFGDPAWYQTVSILCPYSSLGGQQTLN